MCNLLRSMKQYVQYMANSFFSLKKHSAPRHNRLSNIDSEIMWGAEIDISEQLLGLEPGRNTRTVL